MLKGNLTIAHTSSRFSLALFLSILSLFCFPIVCSSQEKPTQEKPTDALTLRQCWRYQTTELDAATAVSDGTNLYFGEQGGRVSAISAEDGKRVWSSEVGGDLFSNFLVVDREIYFVSRSADNSYELRSLSVVSGIANRPTALPFGGRSQVYETAHRIVIATGSGDLAAIDPKDGKVAWSRKIEGTPKVVISRDNALIVGTGDGQIAFIDSADGHITRKLTVKFVPSALLLSDDHLLVGDERGNVTNLDVDKNSPVWTFRSGGKISGIYAVGDSDLLVTSFDNFTYLVDRETGHVIWKRRQPSRIIDAAIVGSKYAGVTPLGEPAVFFLNPENGKSLGQLVMPSSIEFIQPAQLVGESVVTFTNEGLISTGFFGCKRNEKAEAKTSALK